MDMNFIFGWEEYIAGALLFAIGVMGTFIGHMIIRPYVLSKISVDDELKIKLEQGMFLHIVPAVVGVSFLLLLVNVKFLFIG